WRRAQQVVIGDPRRDAVGRGLRLQIGQGDVRPVLAALPGQAGALPRGAAAAGEDREPFAGLHPGPDRVGAVAFAEAPDAGQHDRERPAGRRAAGFRGEVVGAPFIDLAIEGQGHMQLGGGAPARAGQACLAPGKAPGDVLRDRQGGEQPDHATLGSACRRSAQVRFSLRKRRAAPIFASKAVDPARCGNGFAMSDLGNYTATTRAGADTAVDPGLKKFMLGVYQKMALGLVVSAALAWLTSSYAPVSDLMFVKTPTGALAGFTLLGMVVSFAPLVILLGSNFVMRGLNPRSANLLYWVIVALIGASLGTVVLMYAGASVATTFLVTAGAFGGLSLVGYTTKR